MDHMMPDMDGIEATKKIRALGEKYKKMPIIALSANAVSGMYETFIKGGMNDFISKPIDGSALNSILFKYLPPEKIVSGQEQSNDESNDESNNENEENNKALDQNDKAVSLLHDTKIFGIDLEAGLAAFKDVNIYIGVINTFIVSTPPLLEKIKNIDAIDEKNYTILVHGIKGSSRAICAEYAGSKAEELEHASKDGNKEFIRQNNDPFIKTCQTLINCLTTLVQGCKHSNTKEKKKSPDKELLLQLRNAAAGFQIDDSDKIIAEIAKYNYEEDDDLVSFLSEQLDISNFDAVIEKVDTYLQTK
jgi:CheY-like chemotaxis protein